MSSLLSLASGGVFHALIVTNKAGVLLPHLFTLAMLWRYIFCGTIPRVSPARYYLALCLCGARTFLFNKIKAISRSSSIYNLLLNSKTSRKIYLNSPTRFLLISKHSRSILPLTNSHLNLL